MRCILKDVISCAQGKLSIWPVGADAVVGQRCQGERDYKGQADLFADSNLYRKVCDSCMTTKL